MDLTKIISIVNEKSIDRIVIIHPCVSNTRINGSTLLIGKPNLQSARILKNRLDHHFQGCANRPAITMERGNGTQKNRSRMKRLAHGVKRRRIRIREGGGGTDKGGSLPNKSLK